MLDTNMVSYIARGRSKRKRAGVWRSCRRRGCLHLDHHRGRVRYGLAKRPQATGLAAAMEGVLSRLDLLSWDREATQAYGRLRGRFEASSQKMDKHGYADLRARVGRRRGSGNQ
jgi:tRNA(fMet)-specific endonuclease VapC